MEADARYDRLERRLRRLRLAVAVLVLLAPINALTTYGILRRWPDGDRGPSLVKAWFDRGAAKQLLSVQRILVLDEQGVTRAKLACATDGVGLQLLDANERPRASLDVTSAGPGLTFFDDAGRLRAVLQVGQEGPYLAVTDVDGSELFAAPAPAVGSNTADASSGTDAKPSP
ncbi:MAG: hypothetical protein K2Y37_23130 [Pirellulales bacterium]|nr:hypothetical protein [Pirellulales bacterium]